MIGLRCEICGHTEKYNLKNHLKQQHALTTKHYRKQYPRSRTMTGHSKRTVEYWYYRGYSLKQSQEKVKEFQQSSKKRFIQKCLEAGMTEKQAQENWNNKQAKNSTRSVKYYVSRGMNEQEAVEQVKQKQAQYSKLSPKFTGKRHTLESRAKIQKTMQEIVYNIGTENLLARFQNNKQDYRSGQEIQCFTELKQYFPEIVANYKINTYIVDMLLKDIVVEFYGDFWHRNPNLYEIQYTAYGKTSEQVWQKDATREVAIKQKGYRYFIIWESDWKNKKQRVIEQLRQLYEN